MKSSNYIEEYNIECYMSSINLFTPDHFGYKFFPQKRKRNEYAAANTNITKLQEINFQTKNELTIKNIIHKIPNKDLFFVTVSEECAVQFKKTSNELLVECDYVEDEPDQYILLAVPSCANTFYFARILDSERKSEHIAINMMESFSYLLLAIKLLLKEGLVHFNICQKNIALEESTETPRLINFGRAIPVQFVLIENLKPYFYTSSNTIGENESWPLEACAIYYILWLSSESETCTKNDIDAIVSFYRKSNKCLNYLTADEKNAHIMACFDFLSQFEKDTCYDMIKKLFEYWRTWDLYALSYMYMELCQELLSNRCKDNFLLKKFVKILWHNLSPCPTKRLSLAETQTKFNHVFY
tara:strand:+ start:571 stop:1638 length:1068 start_codon:yes stop_codon:yes gene_type:complete